MKRVAKKSEQCALVSTMKNTRTTCNYLAAMPRYLPPATLMKNCLERDLDGIIERVYYDQRKRVEHKYNRRLYFLTCQKDF